LTVGYGITYWISYVWHTSFCIIQHSLSDTHSCNLKRMFHGYQTTVIQPVCRLCFLKQIILKLNTPNNSDNSKLLQSHKLTKLKLTDTSDVWTNGCLKYSDSGGFKVEANGIKIWPSVFICSC